MVRLSPGFVILAELAGSIGYDETEPASEWLAWLGPIIYNARAQVLTTTLQGILDVETGNITAPEEIRLFIATLSANSFNWIVDDLNSGMHTLEVSALCVTFAASQSGSAKANAVIGLGSVTIEEVRMVKGEDAIIRVVKEQRTSKLSEWSMTR